MRAPHDIALVRLDGRGGPAVLLAGIPADALAHQRVRGIQHLFDRLDAMPLLGARDIVLGKRQIVEDRVGLGPLPEQVVVLEEVVVAERGMRDHQRLHGHGVFLHDVADARVGIDHDLVGQRAGALAVHGLVAREVLAKRPVPVQQRHANRGVGVEHLLGRDHLDLVGVDVEAHLSNGDVLDRVIDLFEIVEVPLRLLEQRLGNACLDALCHTNRPHQTLRSSAEKSS